MKDTTLKEIKAALERCSALQADQKQDVQALADATTEIESMKESSDLLDAKAAARFMHLRAFLELVPHRTTSRAEKILDVKRDLLNKCHSYIAEQFAPRCRQIEASTLAKTESALAPILGAGGKLREAARCSEQYQLLSAALVLAVINIFDPEEAPDLASNLLKAAPDLDAFEKQYLS